MKYTANPVTVEAYKITGIGELKKDGEQSLEIYHGVDDQDRPIYEEVEATPAMMARHKPLIGDYWVIQEDGYIYLNPKAVFERKYVIVTSDLDEVVEASVAPVEDHEVASSGTEAHEAA